MADNTHIEWTDATWNPITGCTLVSDGCRHCYAATLAATRLKHHPSRAGLARINAAGEAKFTGEVRLNEKWLDQPLRWRKQRHIFVCAHGDLFHESVPNEWIDRVFSVMALAPQHTFQVLTKRPDRMREYVKAQSEIIERGEFLGSSLASAARNASRAFGHLAWMNAPLSVHGWPLPNVWLGTSIEDQDTADDRIPHLLATPAAVRFVSAEPLLGPVDLRIVQARGSSRVQNCVTGRSFSKTSLERLPDGPRIDWLIVGGESGPHARPMHPDWVRSMRDQCQSAGVPFFFKQWGEWFPYGEVDASGNQNSVTLGERTGFWHEWQDCFSVRLGKRDSGRLLDGREWNEMPEAKHG